MAKFRHLEFLNNLGQFVRVYLLFDKIYNQLWQFLMLLGNFHCCKWLNIEEIIKPSGHASFYLNIRHDHGGGIAVHTLALSMSSNAAD